MADNKPPIIRGGQVVTGPTNLGDNAIGFGESRGFANEFPTPRPLSQIESQGLTTPVESHSDPMVRNREPTDHYETNIEGNEYAALIPSEDSNEYVNILDQKKDDQKIALQQSFFVAKDQDPEQKAKVVSLAGRLNLPTPFVEKNFDELSQKTPQQNDYDSMIQKTPGLAKWLENPDNAALGKDDLENLGKVDQASQFYSQAKSFFPEMRQSAQAGFSSVASSNLLFANILGFADSSPEAIANWNKQAQDLQSRAPDYVKKLNDILAEKGGDVSAAKDQFIGSFKDIQDGEILKALKDYYVGGIKTVGDTLSYLGSLGANPRATAYQLANMTPMGLEAIAAGKFGGLAGLAGGPYAAAGGAIVTSALTNTMIMAGNEMNQILSKSGVDITNPDDMRAALSNPQVRAHLRESSLKYGIPSALVQTVFQAFGGKFLAGPEASVAAKVGGKLTEGAVQAGGMGVSDVAGQLVQNKPEGVDLSQSLNQAAFTLAHSFGSVAAGIGKTMRGELHPETVEAAKQVAAQTKEAMEVHGDLQSLNELGQAVKESKLSERSPEKMAELIKQASPDSKVYFQTDDWDKHWASKGISPVEAAEAVLGDAAPYHEAKATGGSLEIPLSDFASKVGPTDNYNELLPFARSEPDGMTAKESDEFLKNLPSTMDELAKEATENPTEKAADEIKANVKQQLIEAGTLPADADKQASLYSSAFKSLGERTGQDPKALFDQYQLKIGRPLEGKQAPILGPEDHVLEQGNIIDFLGAKEKIAAKKASESKVSTDPGLSGSAETKFDIYKASNNDLVKTLSTRFNRENQPLSTIEIAEIERRIKELMAPGLTDRGTYQVNKIPSENHNHVLALRGVLDENINFLAKEKAYGKPMDERPFPERLKDYKERISSGDASKIKSVIDDLNSLQSSRLNAGRELSFGEMKLRDDAKAKLPEAQKLADEKFKSNTKKVVDMFFGKKSENDRIQETAQIQTAIDESDQAKTPEARLDRFKSRFGEDKFAQKAIDNAQDSKKGPYVKNKKIPGMGFSPNFESKPTGVIGKPEIQHQVRFGEEPDPLAWLDSKYQATKDLIEKHGEQGIPLTINTSSDLIGRDDYIAALPKNTTVNLYPTTRDEDVNRFLFPSNPSRKRLMMAADHLKNAGIKVNVIEPTLKDIFKAVPEAKAAEALGVQGDELKDRITKALKRPFEVIQGGKLFQGPTEFSPERKKFVSRLASAFGTTFSDERLNEPVVLKSLIDSSGASSEKLADLLKGNSASMKKGSESEIPTLISMMSSMRSAIGKNDKILDTIIGSVPIDMVNNLFGSEAAAKVALHDQAMLKDSPAFDANLPIAKGTDTAHSVGLLLREAALEATKISHVSFGSGLEPSEFLTTSKALEDFRLSQKGASNGPRAQIRIGPNKTFSIDLLRNYDLSSLVHETGHFYLEVLRDVASSDKATPEVKKDLQTIHEWLGVKEGEAPSVEQHEKFARGFEAYLMEGKAPSSALKKAFDSFKIWLTHIYRSVKNLNVDLTPEVRQVFDRLLASEDEIKSTELKQNMNPLFPDPIKSGMSKTQADRYIQARDDARKASVTELSNKLLEDVKRKATSAYKTRESSVREEVTKQIDDTNLYKAINQLQGKEVELGRAFDLPKLAKSEVTKLYGKEFVKKLPKGIWAEKNGASMDADVAAEILGFHSGDDMLTQFANAPDRKSAIEAATQSKMQEETPDLLTSDALPEAAMKAVHNDKQAELLRMELEHLASDNMPVLKDVIRKVARRVPTEKAIRDQAEQIIGNKNIEETKPYLFERAERKAAKEAGELLAKGDIDGAFQAKQKELLNHELWKAANDAQEDIEKSLDRFKKLSRSDEDLSKTRDTDLVNAARSLLSMYGIGKFSEADPESFLKKMKAYDEEGYFTVKSLLDSLTENPKPHTDLTYSEFSKLRNAVDALWSLSRSQKQITIEGAKMDRAVAISAMSEKISNRTAPNDKAQYETTKSDFFPQVNLYLLGAKAATTRVEHWASYIDGAETGSVSGPTQKYMVRPILDAAAEYRLHELKMGEDYVKALEPLKSDKNRYKPIWADELVNDKGQRFKFDGKRELLGALLHRGNESNFDKLIRGNKWSVEAWDAFETRMRKEGVLTKADYDVVQSIWDLFEDRKGAAQKAFKEQYGFHFDEITAKPFSNEFGEYKGGYVPAVVDQFRASDAQIRNEKEMLEKFGNSFTYPTTGKGFTKGRVQEYAAPLIMDLDRIPELIAKQLRFTYIEPAVKDVNKMLFDRGFRATIDSYDKSIAGDCLVPWLQAAAQQLSSTPSKGWGGRGADRFFTALKNNAGLNSLALNLSHTVHMFSGLVTMKTLVDWPSYRDGMWTYLRSPKALSDAVLEKSKWMVTHQDQLMDRVREHASDIVSDPTILQDAQRYGKKIGMYVQHTIMSNINLIAWRAAYTQSIARGESESNAIAAGDSIVRRTQHASNPEDVSKFERGSPLQKVLTQFASYFNMRANLEGYESARIYRDFGVKKGALGLLNVVFWGQIANALFHDAAMRSAAGKIKKDDDESDLDTAMDYFFWSQLREGASSFPVVGPALVSGFQSHKGRSAPITIAPVVSHLEAARSIVHTVPKYLSEGTNGKEAIRDTLTLLGLLSGVPLEPLSRPINYLSDVNSGKAEPSGPIDFTRGLLTGKPGK